MIEKYNFNIIISTSNKSKPMIKQSPVGYKKA